MLTMEKTQDIDALVEGMKKLDEVDRRIIFASASALLARKEIQEREEENHEHES